MKLQPEEITSDVDPVTEVTLRLAAIRDSLAALPEGPSPRRYQLLKEQDRLREEAARLATTLGEGRSTAELESELAALKRQRKEIVDSRGGYVMSKGGSSHGAASGAWVKLGLQAVGAADLGWMNARISAIEDLMARRRRESGPGGATYATDH